MFNKSISTKTPRNLLLLFEILSLVLLLVNQWDNIDKTIYYIWIALILIIYISNFILNRITSGDNYIFLIVSMLMSIGIIMIYRIDSELGFKQLLWFIIGIIAF